MAEVLASRVHHVREARHVLHAPADTRSKAISRPVVLVDAER